VCSSGGLGRSTMASTVERRLSRSVVLMAIEIIGH
jgi:hypothetical protein